MTDGHVAPSRTDPGCGCAGRWQDGKWTVGPGPVPHPARAAGQGSRPVPPAPAGRATTGLSAAQLRVWVYRLTR